MNTKWLFRVFMIGILATVGCRKKSTYKCTCLQASTGYVVLETEFEEYSFNDAEVKCSKRESVSIDCILH